MVASTPEGPASQSQGSEFATVVVTRKVDSGREDDFRKWLMRFTTASESFPNNSGTIVLSPTPGQAAVFRIVQRFRDSDSLAEWENSIVRRQLSAEADAFSTSQRQMVTGLEAWFQVGDGPEGPPPKKWKMAVMTFVVVYCLTCVIIPLEIRLLPKSWSFYLINVVTNVLIATLMTYAIMPVVARLLRRWLY